MSKPLLHGISGMRSNDRPRITTAQAAERLGVDASRVRQLLAAGKLTGHRAGRDWLIDPQSVIDYADNRRRPGRPKGEDQC
jgi:excisionase family DNA binding protein